MSGEKFLYEDWGLTSLGWSFASCYLESGWKTMGYMGSGSTVMGSDEQQ